MYLDAPLAPMVPMEVRNGPDTLQLELQIVMSHHVVTGD